MADRSHLSIGEVLSLLQDDFPDVTISKIRFLESQGLLDPERTPSGYRKFYEPDIERLRWILRHQRDHFLPLKVIKDRLEESTAQGLVVPPDEPLAEPTPPTPTLFEPGAESGDPPAGGVGDDYEPIPVPERPRRTNRPTPSIPPMAEPIRTAPTTLPPAAAPAARQQAPSRPAAAAASPTPTRAPVTPPAKAAPAPAPAPTPAPQPAPTASSGDAGSGSTSFSIEELATATGLDVRAVNDLVRFGLLTGRKVGGDTFYDADSLVVAHTAASFVQFGIEARHLRMYKVAAEREAGFMEQVIMPLLKQRNPTARRQAAENLGQLARLGEELRGALLRAALREHTDLR